MSKNLSELVAELFAKPTEGKELSSQIQQFSDEIRNVIQSEDTVYGKFCGLLGSFREIIPDEHQRYQAAVKALSTTSKLNRQEIITAINGQLEELKIVEKGLLPSLSSWRGEQKAMEARSLEMKGEIAKLRERIAQLESEERTIRSGMAAKEKDLELAEKKIRDLFVNIRAEITAVNKKMEALPADGPAAQPTAQEAPVQRDVPGEKQGGGEQKIEPPGAPAPVDTKWQRKCPMCGGRLNLLELENMWQCYTCAYEEPTAGAVQGTGEPKNAPTSPPASAPTTDQSSSFVEPLASMVNEGSKAGTSLFGGQPAIKKKTCPVCRKKMFWFSDANAWRCPSCHYERRI